MHLFLSTVSTIIFEVKVIDDKAMTTLSSLNTILIRTDEVRFRRSSLLIPLLIFSCLTNISIAQDLDSSKKTPLTLESSPTQSLLKTNALLVDAPQLHEDYQYQPKKGLKVSAISKPLLDKDIHGDKDTTEVKAKSIPLKVTLDLPTSIYDRLVIRWNQQMVSALDKGETPDFDLTISPEVQGTWRWQGTRSIVFKPDHRWAFATRYSVSLTGPMKAISGADIGQHFKLKDQFTTPLNQVKKASLHKVVIEDGKPILRWADDLTNHTSIRLCLKQAVRARPPLSLLQLWRVENQVLIEPLKLTYIEDQDVFNQFRSYNSRVCYGLKVMSDIPPYSDFQLKVLPGLSSDEGPLVSNQSFKQDFRSEPHLQLRNAQIKRHQIRLHFNRSIEYSEIHYQMLVLPTGLNPNKMSMEEILKFKLNLTLDINQTAIKTKLSESSRVHYFDHLAQPQAQITVWINPDQVRLNEHNPLARQSITKLSKKYDFGRQWLEVQTQRPELGSVQAGNMPQFMTVEQLNLPTSNIVYYGVDDLCLQWHPLSVQKIAELDLLHTLRREELNQLTLIREGKELCINIFDPQYRFRHRRFPTVPYRFAVRGSATEWSFAGEHTQPVGANSKQTRASDTITSRSTPLAEDKVFKSCESPQDPCRVERSPWKSFYQWGTEQPSLASGSGAHLYLLNQKWRWTPKTENISFHHYSGQTSPSGDRYIQKQSIVQATRYGVIAKLSDQQGHVWVWDLFTHNVVEGAEINVYLSGGSRIATTLTDHDGIAKFSIDEKRLKAAKENLKNDKRRRNKSLKFYISAAYKGDHALVTSENMHKVRDKDYWSNYNEYYDENHNPSNLDNSQPAGLLWSDRGIYRPGDDVHMGGTIARISRGAVEPIRQQSCQALMKDDKGNTVDQKELISSPLGSVQTMFNIPRKHRLGTYRLSLECPLSDQRKHTWRHSIKVSEFRRPTFKVDSHSDKQVTLSGQEVNMKLQANYLYGAPMNNKRWSVYLSGQKSHYSPSAKRSYQRLSDPKGQRLGVIDLSTFSFGPARDARWGDSEVNFVLDTYYSQYSRYTDFNYLYDSASGRLDAHGKTYKALTPKIDGTSPYRLKAAWSVSDSDGQSLSSTSAVTIYPRSGYVGLRSPQGYYHESKKPLSVEAIWVDPLHDDLGKPRDIVIGLYHVKWSRIASKDEIGREQIENQRQVIRVGECALIALSTPQRCTLSSLLSGEHIWVAKALDDRGEISLTTMSVYTYGGDNASWREEEGQQVKLRVTSDHPKIGDQLGILVESPYEEAEAWITVERDKIVYSKRARITPSTMINIPITEDMGPNSWVKVILTRPRTSLPYLNPKPLLPSPQTAHNPLYVDFNDSTSFDLGRPVELYGSHKINVALTPAELSVELKVDQAVKRPGESLKMEVSLQDSNGTPVGGEVFIWALDLAVARLTNYQLPHLLKALHRDRNNLIDTFSHFSHLIAHYTLGNKGNPVGGGGDNEPGADSPPTARGEFKATPFFIGSAPVDQSGRVDFVKKLPDDLTTFKVFAMAISEREKTLNLPSLLRVGQDTTQVTVNLPLMIRPAIPRTLTVGDRFNAGAVVSSLLSHPADTRIIFELSGPVQSLGKTTQSISIPAQDSKIIHAPYQVTGLGDVHVKLTLYRAGQIEDIVTAKVTVKVPAEPESFAERGELVAQPSDQAQVHLIDWRSQYKNNESHPVNDVPLIPAELSVDFGVSIVNMLFGEMVALLEYPYGCLEQRSSRVLPFALSKTLKLAIKTHLAQSASQLSDPQVVIREHLKVMGAMQRRSGGMAYWPNQRSSIHKWASAYAYMVMKELGRAGYPIEFVDLNRLGTYLSSARLQGSILKDKEYHVRSDVAALITFVSSEYQTPLYELEENLLSKKTELNLTAKLLLAASLGGSLDHPSKGARRKTAKRLHQEAMRSFIFDGDQVQLKGHKSSWAWWSFDSPKRKLALALITTLRVQPDSDLVLPLIRSIAQGERGEQHLNTQAAAFKLLAMRDYIKVKESENPDMHVNLSLIQRQDGQQEEALWSTHDIKGADSPMIHVQRKVALNDQPLKTYPMPIVEGLSVKATGKGRLYFQSLLKRYPQSIMRESQNRGFELTRNYRLKVPANASDDHLRAIFNPALTVQQKRTLHPPTLSYQLGDLVEVTLTLTVNNPASYVVINDPLPSGFEVVDPSLKGSSKYGPTQSRGYQNFDHVELKDDRVLLFADRLKGGEYTIRYLVRATTIGRFVRPAAIVEEMYAPDHAGRSDGGYLWIRPTQK